MNRSSVIFLVLLLASSDALAQGRSDFRAVLIPVYDSGPGAFGSVWTSDLRIYNDSEQEAQFQNFVHVAPCQLGAPCPAHVPPKTVVRFGYFPNQIGGFLIYEPKALGSSLHYHLRVRDENRQHQTAGTEIPLVYEHEFRSDAFFLLDVPTTSDVRVTLRIFSLAFEGAEVLVRFLTQPEPTSENFEPRPQLLSQAGVRVTRPPGSDTDDPVFPLRPSFARLDNLPARFPEIAGHSKIMIRIASLNPSIPVWAFVSVTNNATQQFTTITPQPPRID